VIGLATGLRSALLIWLTLPATTFADSCPPLPPAPVPVDQVLNSNWTQVADPQTVRDAGHGETPPLGIGYLRIDNADDFFYRWPGELRLPLWTAADPLHFAGWLSHGRVHLPARGASFPLTGAGLVETGYEHVNFIVHAHTDDGWLQLRLAPGVTAWTHRCHLGLSAVKLAFEPWEDFVRRHGEWLHFRRRVPHALRAEPATAASRVAWIGLDHRLELQELAGDWMRVEVTQPDLTCRSGPEASVPVSRKRGWVQWRDAAVGPWTWIYSRGC